MFQMLACNFAVLSIAVIYFTWRDRLVVRYQRRAEFRDRVAYMLWVAAQRAS